MERVRAVTAHEVPARSPIRVVPGDHVTAGERDAEWPAFALVTCSTGTGWVPVRYLSRERGDAIVLQAYDTTELTVAADDVLDVLERDSESGWVRCRAEDGREGWVPARSVVALP